MTQVTIRRCPVCSGIISHADDVVAALKGDPDVTVNVVDGAKGEFTAEVNGRTYQKDGDSLPAVEEIVAAARGGTPAGV